MATCPRCDGPNYGIHAGYGKIDDICEDCHYPFAATTIKSVTIEIKISDLKAEKDAIPFLVGWLKTATFSGLSGNQKDRFRYQHKDESNIRVSATSIEAVK